MPTVAFSRQGAVAAVQRVGSHHIAPPFRRAVTLFIGAVMIGTGVAAFDASGLGLPPYDVALNALTRHIDVSHGQASWIVAAGLISLAAVLGQRASLATLGWVVLNGITIDAASRIIVDAQSVPVQVVALASGLVLICAGIAAVVFSGMSGGSFELLMRAGEVRGISPTRVRTFLEIGFLSAGVIAGGTFGIGTVVFALTVGKTLRFAVQAMADHHEGRLARLAQVDERDMSTPAPTEDRPIRRRRLLSRS